MTIRFAICSITNLEANDEFDVIFYFWGMDFAENARIILNLLSCIYNEFIFVRRLNEAD